MGTVAWDHDTQMFSNKQPGGMYSVRDVVDTPGKVFWVGSNVTGASDSAGYGQNPGAPFATLDYAVGQCTASRCDTIYVMPGHAEDLDGAADIDLDVAGIRIVGLGRGDLRPTFSFTAAAGTVECNADDMMVENLIFKGDFTDGVTAAVDIKTGCDDLTFRGCTWRGSLATKELLKGVTIEATNSRITFDNCDFYEVTGGDATAAIFAEGAVTNLAVTNCRFVGDWSVAVLDLDAAACTTPLIADNFAYNADAGAGLFCTVHASTVGLFLGNRTLIAKANTVPASDLSASLAVDNKGTDAVNTYGIDWPATATAWT